MKCCVVFSDCSDADKYVIIWDLVSVSLARIYFMTFAYTELQKLQLLYMYMSCHVTIASVFFSLCVNVGILELSY